MRAVVVAAGLHTVAGLSHEAEPGGAVERVPVAAGGRLARAVAGDCVDLGAKADL